MFPSAESTPVHDDPARAAPAVAKWPFLLGDVVLVAAAFGLWAAESPLSELQTALCLGAVALGALVFALPFVVEFFAHTRTVAPAQLLKFELDQARADHLQRQSTVEAALHKHARAAAEAQETSARAAAALEHTARRLDVRLAALETAQKSFAGAAAQLQESAAGEADQEKEDLQRELDRLRQEEAEKLHAAATALAAAAKRLDALAAKLDDALARPVPVAPAPDPALAATLADVRSALEKFLRRDALAPGGRKKDAAADSLADPAAPATPNGALARLETEGGPPLAPVESPAAAPATEPPPAEGDSMLAKALSTAQPADDGSAVARIIQSRPRKPRKPKADPATEADAATPAAETPAAAPDDASPAPPQPEAAVPPAEAEAWEALATGGLDTVTASGEIPDDEPPPPAADTPPPSEPRAALPDPEPAPAAAPAPEISRPTLPAAVLEPENDGGVAVAVTARAKAAALFADDEEAAAPAAQTELIDAEAPAAPPVRRRAAKAAADTTALVARVLIGIGNKPYVRGDGPGLSPDKGVPMEFVEIGKWQWIAPAGAGEPMKVRLLKNDEVPAEGGPVTLKPGELLEIEPRFPG